MYHSVTIGDKNTYDDWHLIAPNRLYVAPPSPKTNYIDILGKNGSLDYTEALSKIPRFGDREGTWEFVILNPGDITDYPLDGEIVRDWPSLYSELMHYFGAKRFNKVVLEDDPDYYYKGRVWVSGFQLSSGWNQVTLSYRFEPFKKRLVLNNGGTVEFDQEYIYPSDNVEITLPISNDISPSQLYLQCSTTKETGLWGIDFRFVNEELDIDTKAHYGGMVSMIGKEKLCVFQDMVVSNDTGNNVVKLYLGPDRDLDPGVFNNDGPVTIKYWWDEAKL